VGGWQCYRVEETRVIKLVFVRDVFVHSSSMFGEVFIAVIGLLQGASEGGKRFVQSNHRQDTRHRESFTWV
jgi:hypothetical protein